MRCIFELSEAVEFFKINLEGPAHRALTDVRRSVLVYKAILGGKNPDDEFKDKVADHFA